MVRKGLFAKSIVGLLVFVVACACAALMCLGSAAAVQEGDDSKLVAASASSHYAPSSSSLTKGAITVSSYFLDDDGVIVQEVRFADGKIVGPTDIGFKVNSDSATPITITSTNPSVMPIPSEYATLTRHGAQEGIHRWVYCDVQASGICEVVITNGVDTVKLPIVAYPANTTAVVSAKAASYKTIELAWKGGIAGASGYEIWRSTDGPYKLVKLVSGGDTSSALLEAPWDVDCSYCVRPYTAYSGKRYPSEESLHSAANSYSYTLARPTVNLKSVAISGARNMKLTWSCSAIGSQCQILRSQSENGTYKKIASVPAGTTTYLDKNLSTCVTYYYKVRVVYPGRANVDSGSRGQYITKKSKVLRKSLSTVQQWGTGTYSSFWSSPDKTYYFADSGRLYAVCYADGKLVVYGFNANLKKVSTKTVKLPKHEVWGGFYHGPDGSNYVAVGYNNPKESKSKVVIRVVKYSSAWKKGKTASIKGSASNSFEGIYHPFDAGSSSFDMQGSTLYLFTSREMFGMGGVHHQSNIAFKINTKTMRATEGNVAYTSHSFNQRVKFKDGAIFLADHGDAHGRGICLTWQNGFGPESAETASALPFKFEGETGDNYTGATLGGMEVGATNILTCGTAQPHGYKVAGVKGFKATWYEGGGTYKQNVFLTVTNRSTGKSSVKWLTSINPKSGKSTVGEARMVKLSDDRFAVMYNVVNDKTGARTLHYKVVNNAGKVLLSKTYGKVAMTGSSQPVLMNGAIYWMEKPEWGGKTTIYRIPAL